MLFVFQGKLGCFLKLPVLRSKSGSFAKRYPGACLWQGTKCVSLVQIIRVQNLCMHHLHCLAMCRKMKKAAAKPIFPCTPPVQQCPCSSHCGVAISAVIAVSIKNMAIQFWRKVAKTPLKHWRKVAKSALKHWKKVVTMP